MSRMTEFRTENKIPWARELVRLGPVLLVIAFTFGLGNLRIQRDALPLLIAGLLAAVIVGYFAIRAVVERRMLHIKITSDWIRIRRGNRLLSAPLHYVQIERSVLFERRYRVAHPRKKLAFTVSLDQFPEAQRDALAALLNAYATTTEGALATLMSIDPTSEQASRRTDP
jgi:hypothetical protein